ncbi:MAG: hypothetical protein ISS52_01580 [Dehalococcoidia bacterium]|nr:hypothetical protein [Dehalococcoidia bacterium]
MDAYESHPHDDEQIFPVEGLTGWELIDNRAHSVADWLRTDLPSSTSASICVAYFSPSGFKPIEHELEHFLSKGGSLSLISSEQITRTDADFLLQLAERYSQIQAKVYPAELTFMHRKVYLLEEADRSHVLVGSSNLTLGGLETNIESNLAGSFPPNHQIVQQWRKNFDTIRAQGVALRKRP